MAMDTDTITLVTAEEAARLAGVSARTIRRWVQRGMLPSSTGEIGILVSPADLVIAQSRAGHGQGQRHGHGHGHGHEDADTTTSTASLVNPQARAQLEAIRDEWLQPLVARIESLSRENGQLQAERDALAAEVAELKRVPAPPTASPEAPGREEAANVALIPRDHGAGGRSGSDEGDEEGRTMRNRWLQLLNHPGLQRGYALVVAVLAATLLALFIIRLTHWPWSIGALLGGIVGGIRVWPMLRDLVRHRRVRRGYGHDPTSTWPDAPDRDHQPRS